MGKSKSNKKHVHMYHYIDLGYGMVWACALPDCSHFMPLIYKGSRIDPRLLGKSCVCFLCRETFTILQETLEEDKLRCDYCVRGVVRQTKTVQEQMADAALKNELARNAEVKAKFKYEFKYEEPWENLPVETRLRLIQEAADIIKQNNESNDSNEVSPVTE